MSVLRLKEFVITKLDDLSKRMHEIGIHSDRIVKFSISQRKKGYDVGFVYKSRENYEN